MGERGLGTPATRAATIETLISEEYIRRLGRELMPTAKAFGLFETLDALGIEILQSPEMTGEWEHKLKEIEHGRMRREDFMREIQKVAERGAEQRPERLWNKDRAEEIVAACRGKTGEVHDEKKPARQLSPLLYDLTSLQREGNSRFGLSARRTLQIAQALYEKHKAITYPRTDSRYLPEDYLEVAKTTLENFAGSEYGEFSKTVL